MGTGDSPDLNIKGKKKKSFFGKIKTKASGVLNKPDVSVKGDASLPSSPDASVSVSLPGVDGKVVSPDLPSGSLDINAPKGDIEIPGASAKLDVDSPDVSGNIGGNLGGDLDISGGLGG